MGFFTRLKNWILGKGYTETTTQQEKQEETIIEPQEPRKKEEKQKQPDITPTKQQQTPTDKKLEQIEKEIKQATTKKQKETKKKTEIEKAIKTMESKTKVKTIEQKIKPQGINYLQVVPTRNMNELKGIYTKIITDQGKINLYDKDGKLDEDLINLLVMGRNQIKKRFSIKITVSIKGETGATLNMQGVLIEHTYLVNNYISIGMEMIDSQQLIQLLETIKNQITQQHGSLGGTVNPTNNLIGKITNITTDISFA